jgi:hypothetical protein
VGHSTNIADLLEHLRSRRRAHNTLRGGLTDQLFIPEGQNLREPERVRYTVGMDQYLLPVNRSDSLAEQRVCEKGDPLVPAGDG